MDMNYQDAMSSATQLERGDREWGSFSNCFQDSLKRLEEMVDDVADLREVCTGEWCEATECLLGEATIAAFAVSEPHWGSRKIPRGSRR